MRIAMIGAPGSGKGTQSKLLAQRYRVPHISTGDLLREAQASDRSFPKEAKQHIEAGQLVDDDLIRRLLEDRLRQRDTKRGFVIDGYPRNIPQAQSLDNLLGMLGRGLQISVYNQVSEEALVKRNTGRLTCADCGAIFNKFSSPPAQKGVCDECGSKKLETRKEDNAKTVATRVERYKAFITPLVTYYRAQHKLRTVSANGKVDEIHEKICAIVDLEIRPLEIDAMVSATDNYSEGDSTVIAGGQINRVAPSNDAKPVRRPASKKTVEPGKAGRKKTASAKKAPTSKAPAKGGATTKKTAVKKAPAKAGPVAKSDATTDATKKVVAKKAAAKKTASSKKVTAKKTTAKKKAPAKKTAAKKTAAKKSSAKKVPTKKTTAKKATAAKGSAKKSSAKKTSGKKKMTGERTPEKKAPSKKAPAKKAPGKKTTAKKNSAKKAPARKK